MKATYLPCVDCGLSLRDATLKEMWHAFCRDCAPEQPFSVILEDCWLLDQRLFILQRDGYIVSIDYPDQVYVVKILGFHPFSNIICVGNH